MLLFILNDETENHSQLVQKVSKQVEGNMRKSVLKLMALRSTAGLKVLPQFRL